MNSAGDLLRFFWALGYTLLERFFEGRISHINGWEAFVVSLSLPGFILRVAVEATDFGPGIRADQDKRRDTDFRASLSPS